jgi:hypothetical protein
MALLSARYARGEITREEFLQMREGLRGCKGFNRVRAARRGRLLDLHDLERVSTAVNLVAGSPVRTPAQALV